MTETKKRSSQAADPVSRNDKAAILAERKKLEALFVDLPDNKRTLVDGLIENAAFMRVTLRELQKDISEHGAIMEAMGGNGYTVTRDNPASKQFSTMIARYSTVISQLIGMLPENDEKDELISWLRDHEADPVDNEPEPEAVGEIMRKQKESRMKPEDPLKKWLKDNGAEIS